MAEALGMKYQQWARYEKGVVAPGADILANICRAHAVSADWLLGLSDERGTSVNAGSGAAVAIGANARASVRGESAARGTSAAHGERPDCAGCPYKEKMKEFEAFFNTIQKKGKRK
jgi:transcriptional regulator with XRE-family HTH domain